MTFAAEVLALDDQLKLRGKLNGKIQSAFRFSLDRNVVDHSKELPFNEAPDFTSLPIWLEWGGRFGIIVGSEEPDEDGSRQAYLFIRRAANLGIDETAFTITAEGNCEEVVGLGATRIPDMGFPIPLDGPLPGVDWAEIATVLNGSVAFINSPRISIISQLLSSRQVQRAAEREGRPLLRFSHVAIRPDQLVLTRKTQGGNERDLALHRVRGFYRRRLGRVEKVRPHWRGNAAHGVVVADYEVKK